MGLERGLHQLEELAGAALGGLRQWLGVALDELAGRGVAGHEPDRRAADGVVAVAADEGDGGGAGGVGHGGLLKCSASGAGGRGKSVSRNPYLG